ncbi:hypothetical protein M2283_010346 [Streptomyces pseudovenezuelae]|uniref:Uncharacterized protein n=1 Tax=Streptomyces pseudovenezuelae TaxID=67350 RepID=A0ABT6M4G1_9ACTN|nr:hypothetical protein [Streptomyces pseudovenezuelae]
MARYGVPLAQTAPAGLAAAGIEPVLLPPAPQLEAAPEPSPEDTGTFPIPAGPGRTREMGAGSDTEPSEDDYRLTFKEPTDASHSTTGHFRSGVEATNSITNGNIHPISDSDLNTYVTAFSHHEKARRGGPSAPETDREQQQEHVAKPGPSSAGPHVGLQESPRDAEGNAAQKESAPPAGTSNKPTQSPQEQGKLTVPDRYYLVWMNYQTEHGHEPTAQQLSLYLAEQGLLGRDDKPVSPSNLRRHLLRWRIYNIWAKHRAHTTHPPSDRIAAHCATHGITGQYNRTITAGFITTETPDFQRRWQLLKKTQMQ